MVERTIRIMDSAVDSNKLASGAVIGADIANQTLTAAKASTSAWLMAGRWNIVPATTATIGEWGVTFAAVPKVFLQVVGDTAGTTVNVTTISTTESTIYASHDSSVDWLCAINLV